MQFSNLLLSIISLSLASTTLGAPTDERVQKRDDEGPVVVKLKTTVHNIVTNTHFVEGSVRTVTNTDVQTDVTTTTRYTATVTSTVFGTPITYTTEAATPIDTSNIKIPTETTPAATSTPTTSTTSTSSTKSSSSKSSKAKITSSPSPVAAAAKPTETTEVVTDDKTTDGPSITDIANIPTSTDSYIIDNVTTSKADGVCYVDYDYYVDGEEEETVTSTSTIYTTVTRS